MSEQTETSEKQPLSVFITGATTGAGRALVRRFAARGYRVTGTTDAGLPGAEMIRADGGTPTYPDLTRTSEVRSLMQMARADVVVHAAGTPLNGLPYTRSNWEKYRHILTKATDSVMTAAGQAGVQRVIYPGFAFIYGDKHGAWVDEHDRPAAGEAAYAAALQAEQAVLDGGLPGVVLRTGFLYGSDEESTLETAEAIRSGRALPSGRGQAGWLHIEDLAGAALAVAEFDGELAPGELYTLADDEPATPDEFLRQFSQALGISTPSIRGGLLAALPFGDPLQRLMLEHSARVLNHGFKARFGWRPQFPTLREGIERTLLLWRAAEGVAS